MEYTALVRGFAEKFGIADIEIQDGATAVEIDDMTVGLIHDEASDTIMAVVDIGHPPPDADGPMGSTMLKANYLLGGTSGAILCQNPDTDAYALMRIWPLASHDIDTFTKALGKLVDNAENWKDVVSGMKVAEEAKNEMDDDDDDSIPPLSPFSTNGFMQV